MAIPSYNRPAKSTGAVTPPAGHSDAVNRQGPGKQWLWVVSNALLPCTTRSLRNGINPSPTVADWPRVSNTTASSISAWVIHNRGGAILHAPVTGAGGRTAANPAVAGRRQR